MGIPSTGGEMLESIRKKYGHAELADLSRASGVSISTLDGWQRLPAAKLSARGRKHYRRIFEGIVVPEKEHHITTADLAAKLDRVAGLLESLLTLDREGRLGETIHVKRKRHSGGGAA